MQRIRLDDSAVQAEVMNVDTIGRACGGYRPALQGTAVSGDPTFDHAVRNLAGDLLIVNTVVARAAAEGDPSSIARLLRSVATGAMKAERALASDDPVRVTVRRAIERLIRALGIRSLFPKSAGADPFLTGCEDATDAILREAVL
jgi:hypothetical protein